MDDVLALGSQILASQPFSALVGAGLSEFSVGKATLTIPIKDSLKQQNGYVHGGVISYAADNALTFAGGSVLGTAVLTSGFKINYLSPATGEQLVARAIVIHAGERQAVCRCDGFVSSRGQETLCDIVH